MPVSPERKYKLLPSICLLRLGVRPPLCPWVAHSSRPGLQLFPGTLSWNQSHLWLPPTHILSVIQRLLVRVVSGPGVQASISVSLTRSKSVLEPWRLPQLSRVEVGVKGPCFPEATQAVDRMLGCKAQTPPCSFVSFLGQVA